MDNYEFLQLCLLEIEEKLEWGSSSQWTNREFNELREIIFKACGVYLSTSSLRRLYGKSTDYKKRYNPQPNTKDALCNFLGYKGWMDFKKQKTKKEKKKRFVENNKAILILLILSSLILLIIVLGKKGILNPKIDLGVNINNSITFNGENLMGTDIPHTVMVNYNKQNTKGKYYINWGDIPQDGGKAPEPIELLNDSGTITHTYFNKNVHKIELLDEKQLSLKTLYSFISTNNWECYVKQGKKTLYIDSVDFIKDGYFCIKNKLVYAYGIDSIQPYRIYYRNNKDFNIKGSDFIFSSSFFPMFDKHIVDCYHVQFEIFGSLGNHIITFVNKGCSGEIRAIYLAQNEINGASNDLSDFTINNNEWYKLNFRVTNDTAVINLNHNEILKRGNINSIGDIIALRVEFKGTGCIKDIGISSFE